MQRSAGILEVRVDRRRVPRDRRARARHAARRQPPAAPRARLRRGAPRGRASSDDICLAALELFQVDGEGLDKLDRDILCAIAQKFDGGPVGLDTLAVALGEEADTLQDVYEPYLIMQGFLQAHAAGSRAHARRASRTADSTPPRRVRHAVRGLRRVAAARRRRCDSVAASPGAARLYSRPWTTCFLHACCGPCATVPVPAWRSRGRRAAPLVLEPQRPARGVEHERRRAGLDAVRGRGGRRALTAWRMATTPGSEWRAWAASLAATPPEARCATCLRLRMADAAAAAAATGADALLHHAERESLPAPRPDPRRPASRPPTSTASSSSTSTCGRGSARAIAESRRLGLYRQKYCGCAASKWEAWSERDARKVAG